MHPPKFWCNNHLKFSFPIPPLALLFLPINFSNNMMGVILNDECGKCLAFKNWATKEVSCFSSLQPCFASKAKSKRLRSLNPIPPSSFDLAILLHFNQ
ncbi:hypothetical protein Scep_010464 [Stephania cephalantha]|uniref:Uncharacterized protein n=1 Tax=Stephania cephalantha TaxID=152367 RepID=A0AAP0PDC3_9MAGN